VFELASLTDEALLEFAYDEEESEEDGDIFIVLFAHVPDTGMIPMGFDRGGGVIEMDVEAESGDEMSFNASKSFIILCIRSYSFF
jgi:hypothetical protein